MEGWRLTRKDNLWLFLKEHGVRKHVKKKTCNRSGTKVLCRKKCKTVVSNPFWALNYWCWRRNQAVWERFERYYMKGRCASHGMPLRKSDSPESFWAFLCWDVAVFLPTARPDSDGSKRAALRRTCLPLAWMECIYLSLAPATAVVTETASRVCVSVTWDTQVRPVCVSDSLLVKVHSYKENIFWVCHFLCLRILELAIQALSCQVFCSFKPRSKKTC